MKSTQRVANLSSIFLLLCMLLHFAGALPQARVFADPRTPRAHRSGEKAAPSSTPAAAPKVPAPASASSAMKPKAISIPLFFEANKGQVDSRVRFLTRGNGYTLLLTPTETILAESKTHVAGDAKNWGEFPKFSVTSGTAMRMQLVGANPAPQMSGLDELSGKVNYLIGNDPSRWHTGVPLFSEVREQQVYPGVDLRFHGDQKQLEYDFIVVPGGDPSQIDFRIRGASRIEIDSQGDLVLHGPDSDFRMHKPVIYQTVGSERRLVAGNFVKKGKRDIGFQVGSYDQTLPLVIDPTVLLATFLGGNGDDQSLGIAIDQANNMVYATGFTTDIGTFPEASHLIGATGATAYGFVVKMDANTTGSDSFVYLTFIGGITSFPGDAGQGFPCETLLSNVALDFSQGSSNANVEPVVSGGTQCSDYPHATGTVGSVDGTASGYLAAVVTRLNASGTAVDSSILLGGNNAGLNNAFLSVDSLGNSLITGGAFSTNLPTTAGAYMTSFNNGNTGANAGNTDCYIAKLPRGAFNSPSYATYLNVGANSANTTNGDVGCGAIEDSTGKIDAGGNTFSTVAFNVGVDGTSLANGFQTTFQGAQDVFGLQLDPTQSGTAELKYASYYSGGGTSITQVLTGALDLGSGVVAMAGFTTANGTTGNIPLANAFQTSNASTGGNGENGFFVVFNTTTTGPASLLCSSYFGGSSGNDRIFGIALDPEDMNDFRIPLVGQTRSSDFPHANQIQSFQGTQDGFVAEMKVPRPGQSFAASLFYSTWVGGGVQVSGESERMEAVAVGPGGTVYVTGRTPSSNFFSASGTTVNGFQTACTSCNSADDVVIFSLGTSSTATLTSISVTPASASISAGSTQQFTATGFFSDGTDQNITTTVTWNSSNPGVATISNTAGTNGLATGVSGGTSNITASQGAVASSASVLTVTGAQQFTLTVTDAGTGSGNVTSSPSGINCTTGDPTGCSANFNSGTVVTLTAAPGTGSTFAGWSGACTNATGTCTVTMNAAQNVTATFNVQQFLLTVTIAGTGNGTVTSQAGLNPAINCTKGATSGCTADYNSGTVVTLTAAPNTGSTFAGWSGACTNTTGTCTVTMNAAQNVTATFTAQQFTLTVTDAGTGTGTVTSQSGLTPAINCTTGSTTGCSANYNSGTSVVLTATPTNGSTFAGWSGACTNATGTCSVTMNAAENVTATFTAAVQTFTLTVTDAGTGSGTVTSQTGLSPAINCTTGSTTGCSANYNAGTMVTLTATPATGSAFVGWSGACTNATGSCTVTMNAAENVTATFNSTGGGGVASVSPSSLNFGNQIFGGAGATLPATLTDTGTGPLGNISITSNNPDYTITNNTCPVSPATLGPGASCSWDTTFVPSFEAPDPGAITVTDDAAIGTTLVPLSGTGVNGTANLSPFAFDFGPQAAGTTSAAETETFSNTSASAITIGAPTFVGHAMLDFGILNNQCGTSVNPSSSCTMGATFTPSTTVPGPRTADLSITSSTTGQTYVSHLVGNGAIRHLPGFLINTFPPNDDDSVGPVNIGFANAINFFGTNFSQLFVNNNGNVTFGQPFFTFTPNGLNGNNGGIPIIAPFFADVYTLTQGSAVVTYGNDTVNGRPAFGVNYDNVAYFAEESPTLLNSFQVILIDRSDTGTGNFDIEFNYDKIQWETGDASGGTGGLGGTSAAVGYSNGTGTPGTNFQLAGSLVNGALLDVPTASGFPGLINSDLNNNVLGRYLFQVRNGQVQGADLALTMSHSPDPVAAGANETYTLTVTNGGPSDATNTTVTDTLPTNATLVSATPSQGATCTGTVTLTCNLGTLTNGSSATITVIVTVNVGATGTVTNLASVTSDLPDSTPSDNSASASATISAAATLVSIAVTPANPTIAISGTQQFTATGTFSDNSTQNITSTVTWASGTTSVATITAGGLATGVATGTSTISATQSGITGSTLLTVNASPVVITVAPPPPGQPAVPSINPGGQAAYGLVLTAVPGFSGTITLGCTATTSTGAPASQFITCAPNPNTVTIQPGGSTEVAIVLNTFCTGTTTAMGLPFTGGPMTGIGLLLAVLALSSVVWMYRRKPRWVLTFAVMALAIYGAAGCGSLAKGPAGPTPAGLYNLTITFTVNGQTFTGPTVQLNVL